MCVCVNTCFQGSCLVSRPAAGFTRRLDATSSSWPCYGNKRPLEPKASPLVENEEARMRKEEAGGHGTTFQTVSNKAMQSGGISSSGQLDVPATNFNCLQLNQVKVYNAAGIVVTKVGLHSEPSSCEQPSKCVSPQSHCGLWCDPRRGALHVHRPSSWGTHPECSVCTPGLLLIPLDPRYCMIPLILRRRAH